MHTSHYLTQVEREWWLPKYHYCTQAETHAWKGCGYDGALKLNERCGTVLLTCCVNYKVYLNVVLWFDLYSSPNTICILSLVPMFIVCVNLAVLKSIPIAPNILFWSVFGVFLEMLAFQSLHLVTIQGHRLSHKKLTK